MIRVFFKTFFEAFIREFKKRRKQRKAIAEWQKFIVECPECGAIVNYLIQSGICPHESKTENYENQKGF